MSVPNLDIRENPGKSRTPVTVPDTFASALNTAADSVPTLVSPLLEQAKAKENSWIKHGALTLMKQEEQARKDAIAWAAYHALQQVPAEDPPALCALLPLFYEKACSSSSNG